jgi:hypothetical protein
MNLPSFGYAGSVTHQAEDPVETPAPNPSDSEDVVTALETAAIFAQKGDVTETAHWLSRAAESASLHGDTLRAAVLARAVASLPTLESEESSPDAAPDTRERRLPTPPPRRVSVRPPPPSERARSQSDDSQPMLLVRPPTPMPAKVAPAPVAQKSTPAPAPVARKSTPAPAPVVQKSTPAPAAIAQKSTPAPAAVAQKSTPAPAVARASSRPLSAAALAPNLPHHEESAVRESSASTATNKPSDRPSMSPALRHETHRPFPLHGARASIAASEGSTRFYVVKVLDEGEPVPQGEQEAYIVLVDPKAAR